MTITQLHHVIYKYTTDEVRKNPKLALENTIELCFFCHKVGNSMALIEKQKVRAKKIQELIARIKERE